jgi:hypothetical protein
LLKGKKLIIKKGGEIMLFRFGFIFLICGVFSFCLADSEGWKNFWNNTKVAYENAKTTCTKVANESNRIYDDAKEGYKRSDWVPYEKRDNDNDGYPNGQDRWPDDSKYH